LALIGLEQLTGVEVVIVTAESFDTSDPCGLYITTGKRSAVERDCKKPPKICVNGATAIFVAYGDFGFSLADMTAEGAEALFSCLFWLVRHYL
jgi:hypothetical protein